METYVSFDDLDRQLRQLLGEQHFDMVIHAAAVSDFSVAEVSSGPGESPSERGKLVSGGEWVLRLKPNPKLLHRIRGYSCNPNVRVIGFKLTVDADAEQARAAVARQFEEAGTDYVVHNDFSAITPERHAYVVHTPDGGRTDCGDGRALARAIGALLETAA